MLLERSAAAATEAGADVGVDVLIVVLHHHRPRRSAAAEHAAAEEAASAAAALGVLPPDDDKGEAWRRGVVGAGVVAVAASGVFCEPQLEREVMAELEAVGGADGVPAFGEAALRVFFFFEVEEEEDEEEKERVSVGFRYYLSLGILSPPTGALSSDWRAVAG